ncbi:MAG: DegV family protein [Clostridia bacterium]|nr:DegV family protein [Clostridia bacterium]
MQRKFVIVTDSGCDMSEEYLSQHGVETVHLGFLMDNVLYSGEDGEKIDTKIFYEQVRKGAMPTTHQVNVECAKEHVEKYLKEGKDVLVIAFSGALSGTANSFKVAAKELSEKYPTQKVLVSDSLCASMGQGLYLDYALKKADTGADLEETYDYIEGIKQNICHLFTVDNLFHLKRGGRVSAVTAIVGTLLSIKPVMHVSPEGKLVPISKAMGRKKSIKSLLDKMKELAILEKGEPIFISHGDCIEDATALAEMIKTIYPQNPVTINYVGPVIGSHSGPGTLALFFRGKQR